MNGSLHHIEIYVEDIQKSRAFYEWLLNKLGYKLYQEWDLGFSFKLGETYIVFVEVEEKYKDYGYHRKRIGLNHLAFNVETKAMVDEITNDLINQDIGILYAGRHPFAGGSDHYAVYFEAPDRIKLEIISNEN